MKYNKVFRILALAVIFSLLMLAIPATPALAVITLTLNPAFGPPGQAITITGTDFAPSSSGVVWFDSDNDSVRDAGEPQVSVATNASGVLSAGTTLTVPTVPRGTTYKVQADIPTGAPIEASSPFSVTPQITLSASLGYVGDTITVSGNGFAAGSVTILFDAVSKGTTTTTATGTFTGFTLTVPESTKGPHTIRAQETSTPANNDTATFTVSPKITITPTSGAVGDTVTIRGTGFAASSTVTISFDATSVGTSATTNSSGTFPSTSFTIPSTSRGSHTIKAQDASANYATATFTVAQKITIAPPSGPSGATVRVDGTGFGASKTITIKYNNNPVTTNPASVTTGATGNFTASFTVPGSLAGTYPVEASDSSANSATANFVSTTDATISQTTSEAAPGHVGMQLIITGTNFKPSSDITITYTSEPVVFHTTSGADGSFSYTFKVPKSEHGPHTITVTDNNTTKVFPFFMELTPPETPSPLLPAVDTKAKSEASFDWEAVTDDSEPVTYDLQVASDENFTTLLLDKTGLTTSEYTLLEEEKLESTKKEAPYYWHARAVDAASNASDWTSAGTFYVGFIFPEIKGWLLYTLMGVIALLFFIFGVWVGKRSGGGYY